MNEEKNSICLTDTRVRILKHQNTNAFTHLYDELLMNQRLRKNFLYESVDRDVSLYRHSILPSSMNDDHVDCR